MGVCLAAAAAMTGGCGPPEVRSDYPPPGQMQVISVTRLDREEEPNLMLNGDFETWWNGAAACEGFLPPNAEYSAVKHVKLQGDSGYSVVQSWTASDHKAGLAELFRTEIAGVTPGTAYRLDITAAGGGGLVQIAAWEQRKNGDVLLLDKAPVLLQPGSGALKRYSGEITTGEGGTLILAARCGGAVKGEITVQWCEWRLSRNGLGF